MASIQSFVTRLSDAGGPGTLTGSLPMQFSVASAGPFPLAGHVAVAGSDVGGSLMIEYSELEFGPLAVAGVTTGPDDDEGTHEVDVTLGAAQLQGHYELFALESSRVDLDVGGAVQPFPALEALSMDPTGGAGDDPTITEAQYDQIMQANAQKPKLAESPAGQQMLDSYNQYNDAYHDAFKSNALLRQYWSAGGAIAEMSDHTSDALDQGTVVNPADKTFGTSGFTYNMNALQQKFNVWAACVNDNPAAAAAALKFGTAVATTTGNTKTTINPMTGGEVYATVDQAKPAPAANLLAAPEEHPLHAPLLSIVQNSHDDRHLDILANQGMELNDDEVKALQEIYAESLRVKDPAARLPIASGNCAVAVGETVFRFRLTRQPNDTITVKLVQSSLSLDGLDYGAGQWPGEAGDVARERLESAAFLRGIIEDRINSQLTRLVRGLAAQSA
jgi:hypothetical protein